MVMPFTIANTIYEAPEIVVAPPSIATSHSYFVDEALTTMVNNNDTIDASVQSLFTRIEITNDGLLPYELNLSSNSNLKQVAIDGVNGSDISSNVATSIGMIEPGETIAFMAEIELTENGLLENAIQIETVEPFVEMNVGVDLDDNTRAHRDTHFYNYVVSETNLTTTQEISLNVENAVTPPNPEPTLPPTGMMNYHLVIIFGMLVVVGLKVFYNKNQVK